MTSTLIVIEDLVHSYSYYKNIRMQLETNKNSLSYHLLASKAREYRCELIRKLKNELMVLYTKNGTYLFYWMLQIFNDDIEIIRLCVENGVNLKLKKSGGLIYRIIRENINTEIRKYLLDEIIKIPENKKIISDNYTQFLKTAIHYKNTDFIRWLTSIQKIRFILFTKAIQKPNPVFENRDLTAQIAQYI